MKTFWRVDELHIIKDPDIKKVKDTFKSIKSQADAFNDNHDTDEVLAILVRWIGWDVHLERTEHDAKIP